MYREYIVLVVQAGTTAKSAKSCRDIVEIRAIQERLWDLAVENVRLGDTTDISSLYVQSVDEMLNVTALRVAVALQSRMPPRLLVVLNILVGLGCSRSAPDRKSCLASKLVDAGPGAVVLDRDDDDRVLDDPERGVIGYPSNR